MDEAETTQEDPRGPGPEVDWGPIQGPPTDPERSEDVHDIQLGTVVQDADARNWVFIGWRQNTAGRQAYFALEEKGFRHGEAITYHAAIATTLERKFPALASMRRS